MSRWSLLIFKSVGQRSCWSVIPCAADNSRTLCPRSFQLPYIGNISRREFLAKMMLVEGVFKFHWVQFSLFQILSIKTYSRVNFSLCLFLAISGRSRIQRKLNSREKFRIYGIYIQYKIYSLEVQQFNGIQRYNARRGCTDPPPPPPKKKTNYMSTSILRTSSRKCNKRVYFIYLP